MKQEIICNEIKGVAEKNGHTLVKYNISSLVINGEKNNAFANIFNEFYSSVTENFKKYAETRLLKRAEKSYNEEFIPFGAVLKYICAFSSGNIVSVVTDASVFSNGKTETKRVTQNWHKEKKRMLLFEDFFLREEKKTLIRAICEEAKLRQTAEKASFFVDFEKRIKNHFSKENFYLTPKGYGFFYPQGCVSQGKGVDVFFLLGYRGKGELNPY